MYWVFQSIKCKSEICDKWTIAMALQNVVTIKKKVSRLIYIINNNFKNKIYRYTIYVLI